MLTLNDGRAELWQWDTGRTLAVDADCSQVHFSNKVFGRSIDVDVADGVAIIPDVLLQTDKDLNVWAFVGTAENGYTKISKTFKVNRRNKPADYVLTPTDQMTLQAIQRQIGDLADLTTEAKDNLVAAINEAAKSVGGGGVQSDWNQNNETQPDYVKNRPFYTGNPVETVVVEDSTVTFEDCGGVYGAEFPSTFEATGGETYKVSWDGTVYECTCVDYGGQLVIGNPSILGEGSDTGEPFFMDITNGKGIVIITADTSATHTFSISATVVPVVKIDPKYLPMPISFKPAGKSYLTFSSPNSFTLAVNDSTKHWDGTLEYFASDKTWTVWDGTTTLSAVDNDGEYVLYLRGTWNTVITGSSENYRWVLTGSDIACTGNIENLLDYATVELGEQATMANNCYRGMFYNCTSLTKAPELPATTLSNNCYQVMFFGCTSLTQAPALPATTMAGWCYYKMFQSCSSLIQAPALPATTLGDSCYGSMFRRCTSLTQAPALPATTLAHGCYWGMFEECTSLTQAPELPATTLAERCYQGMFNNCTSLTQAPALPATTLAKYCYNGMFYRCTSIKLSSTRTGEYTQEYRIPSSGNGVTATDALTDMFASTGGTFTGTPSINTTYYLSSDNMIVRETEIDTLNGYVGSMIDAAIEEYADTAEYIIPSSTEGSTKKFKITVDDSGTLTATEVV